MVIEGCRRNGGSERSEGWWDTGEARDKKNTKKVAKKVAKTKV